jgi:hypothetical protein
MKSLLMTVSFLMTTAFCMNAQTPVLASYYEIKDALVSSNATAAAAHAGEFVQAVDAIAIPDCAASKSHALSQVLDKLHADGQQIATAKNIGKQREVFAGLSAGVVLLSQAIHLSAAPIYEQYCPMKKWVWLSNEPAIRNPYYGVAMLTCGNITETIKP